MSLPVVLRKPAQVEFHKGVTWYEKQRPGLGVYFHAEVRRILREIADQPDKYPVVLEDIREASVSRFPFCIYYRIRPQRVVVLSVFHTSRDPAVWQSRV